MKDVENDQLVRDLYLILEFAKLGARVSVCHSCNDCKRKECKYRPEWGDNVRWNCPLWVAERQERMNDDLVSRKAAVDALWSLDVELRPTAIDAILNMLNGLPSTERKKGKWMVKYEDWRKQQHWSKCSECGFDTSSQYNFCPNCGADMRSEE